MKRGLISALIVVILVTFANGIGTSHVSADTTDPFDALRTKWLEMLTGGTAYDPTNPDIAARITDITSTAQGYWDSMKKTADRTYLWSDASSVMGLNATATAQKTSTYTWITAMALAYATEGSALQGNVNLKADIISALDWLYQNAYNETMSDSSGNWWDLEIGVPRQLHNIVVLMYDDLSSGQITNYMTAIGHFATKTELFNNTGANRVWLAGVVGLTGVLTNNGQQIADARDALSKVFLYVTQNDGFYEDGSFIQHTYLAYTGGYGTSLLIDVSKLVYWLDGSEWEVTDPNSANIYNWVYKSFEPLMYKGLMMDMVRGRQVSRDYSTDHISGHDVITAVMRISRFSPPADAAALRSMVKSWIVNDTYRDYFKYAAISDILQAKAIVNDSGVAERTAPSQYLQYASMDRAVQVRPNYSFGLSMSSNRIATHEVTNGENVLGWYQGEGVTYLYNKDISQYTDDYWPTVNPYRLPGTTVDTQTRTSGSGDGYRGSTREAGGTELLGSYGTTAMKVKGETNSLTAKKSWFNFDDEIVALGAGITSTDNRIIETTVENRKLEGVGDNALTVNGVAASSAMQWNGTMTGVNTIHLAGNTEGSDIGYYFPGGSRVKGLREMRTGSWSKIDTRPTASKDPITRPYLTLWFDHGANPQDATYEYVLLPNKSTTETEAYAGNPDIIILENSPNAQAVQEKILNITGIQFWNDAVKTVGDVTSNKRAAVMTQETNGGLTLSVSDPSQKNTGTIDLEINKKATSILSLDPSITVTQISPTIKLSVQTTGSLGKTYHASFSFASATAKPETPAHFKATAGDGEVLLTWDNASRAAGYIVKYGTSSGNYMNTVDVGPLTSYMLRELTNNQTYYITVSAYNNKGESSSANELSATPFFTKILDNDAATGVSKTTGWTTSTAVGRYGANSLHDGNTGRGSKSVTYTPDLPAGNYRVSAWWVESTNRSSVVPITVHHAGETATVSVNQQTGGSEWNDLGVYEFGGGSSENVMISNMGANGYVSADAVRFELVSNVVPELH